MPGSFTARGEPDWSRSLIITSIGKKRSGKSVMTLFMARQYPYDLIVIDVAADDGPMGERVHDLHGNVEDLPRRFPEHLRKERERLILRYVPDPGSPTLAEDMDAVVGMAMAHGKATGNCGLLVHEMGVLAASNRVPAHTRRALMHNRHNGLTLFAAMPRPITADPLVIAQSDLVYVFELPNPADRRRVAEVIGWPPDDFDDAVHALGPHEYLRFDSNEMQPEPGDKDLRLVHFDALPEDVATSTIRWAQGTTHTEGEKPQ